MTMNHARALKKLAADKLVKAIDEDVARLVAHTRARGGPEGAAQVLPPLLRRWNCVVQTEDALVPAHARQIITLALAIVLHQYGLADPRLSEQARNAIDALNAGVILSDDFCRQSEAIKHTFLDSAPAPLKRSPSRPDDTTFYRAGDVIAIRLDRHVYAAYVHHCAELNESPVVEFYDAVFARPPTLAELNGLQARGETCNDGTTRAARFSVAGLKYLPDPAHQVTLVQGAVEQPPYSQHLARPVGLYAMSDIFELQQVLEHLFPHTSGGQ
ncbi:hypothetical protein SAMN05216588_10647 [Pseudomonas flavescens]|uniref:Uncharacterized protein n=1 Tax=Phytopseudomonas flavescens TaxID=29435 RepID=A0A1G8E2A0_9GAMM|nr:hypothetical protein [Pseudomonas flavescens]SDH64053.1 hypothetical protein SAMN05216588_10647 [Pseudomonas flavescens]